jgi:hypothetical protein
MYISRSEPLCKFRYPWTWTLSAAVHITMDNWMEPKILGYKPSSAGNYSKRRDDVKIVICSEVVRNRRKNEISTSPAVKTGTQEYHRRKTLHSRRKPNDNMRGPFGDVSLTRSRIIETIRRCRPNERYGSCKKYSSFAKHPSKHTRILYNCICWIAACLESKLRRKFVYRYRHVECKCCWCVRLSIFGPNSVKDATSLLTVDVEDLPFDVSSRCSRLSFTVDSRCRRPTFRCQQSV